MSLVGDTGGTDPFVTATVLVRLHRSPSRPLGSSGTGSHASPGPGPQTPSQLVQLTRTRMITQRPDQVALAQPLYDAGEHTVQQIADIFRSHAPRSTVTSTADEGQKPRLAKVADGAGPPHRRAESSPDQRGWRLVTAFLPAPRFRHSPGLARKETAEGFPRSAAELLAQRPSLGWRRTISGRFEPLSLDRRSTARMVTPEHRPDAQRGRRADGPLRGSEGDLG